MAFVLLCMPELLVLVLIIILNVQRERQIPGMPSLHCHCLWEFRYILSPFVQLFILLFCLIFLLIYFCVCWFQSVIYWDLYGTNMTEWPLNTATSVHNRLWRPIMWGIKHPTFSRQSSQMAVRLSALCAGQALLPRSIFWYSFLLEVKSTPEP
jgi:hypothetical protein